MCDLNDHDDESLPGDPSNADLAVLLAIIVGIGVFLMWTLV